MNPATTGEKQQQFVPVFFLLIPYNQLYMFLFDGTNMPTAAIAMTIR